MFSDWLSALSVTPAMVLLPAMVLHLGLTRLNQTLGSLHLTIANRWLRWGIVAAALTEVLRAVGEPERSWSVLFGVFLVGWALVETLYHWWAIHTLSTSELPLFPRFTLNPAGDEWPVQREFLRLREQLRAAGYRGVQALRAEVAPGVFVRAAVYHSTDGGVRLQVNFLPQVSGRVAMTLSLASLLTDGRRLVTDNVFLPFAGFYPEAWAVERRPLMRSWARLQRRHLARTKQAGAEVGSWDTEPLGDLNAQQVELEQVNTQLGFLHAHKDREEWGKLTAEGRWRVWKELFLLNYFGRASRYE
jgi:hypothetical protein